MNKEDQATTAEESVEEEDGAYPARYYAKRPKTPPDEVLEQLFSTEPNILVEDNFPNSKHITMVVSKPLAAALNHYCKKYPHLKRGELMRSALKQGLLIRPEFVKIYQEKVDRYTEIYEEEQEMMEGENA
jgi:hypothetical protein